MEISGETKKELLFENNWPADLYLEGSDQFRGWFNSSLITATILANKSPYKQVLSHGFVVDSQGKKMSKSLGNVIDLEEMRQKFGADVLRLWATTADFTKEIRVSESILSRVHENYQKIRNTFRFLLGNLHYLKEEKELEKELESVDYWVLQQLRQLIKYSEVKYQQYEFNAVYTALLNFCNDNLSSFYFEVSKNNLYCDSLEAKRRKQIITVLYYLLGKLLTIIVPILPFLAEEIYQHIPFQFGYSQVESVMLMPKLELNFLFPCKDSEIITDFLLLRKDVFLALERARQTKLIDNNFRALVWVCAKKKEQELNHFLSLDLAGLLTVGRVKFINKESQKKDPKFIEGQNYWVKIERIEEEGCLRCYNYQVLQNKLCSRCQKVFS